MPEERRARGDCELCYETGICSGARRGVHNRWWERLTMMTLVAVGAHDLLTLDDPFNIMLMIHLVCPL